MLCFIFCERGIEASPNTFLQVLFVRICDYCRTVSNIEALQIRPNDHEVTREAAPPWTAQSDIDQEIQTTSNKQTKK